MMVVSISNPQDSIDPHFHEYPVGHQLLVEIDVTPIDQPPHPLVDPVKRFPFLRPKNCGGGLIPHPWSDQITFGTDQS